MTRRTTQTNPVEEAREAKVACDEELNLLRSRLSEEQRNLLVAEDAAREAGLTLARSGADADRIASREALAVKAEIERMVSHLSEILIPEAQFACDEAAERLDQANRAEAAALAEAACEAAAQRLAIEYPDLVQRLEELKRIVAEADAKAAEVNRALPSGLKPVMPVEARVRDLPAEPAREVSREPVSVWCWAGTTNPVPEDRVADIVATGTRRHHSLGPTPHHVLLSRSGGNTKPVERRRLLRVTFCDATKHVHGPRIEDATLPSLRPPERRARSWSELRPLDAEGAAE
jgi:hypothetical protein